MEQNSPYSIEFLPAALNDMAEIVSTFVMLGSKQGAVRIRSKMIKAAENISRMPYIGAALSDNKLKSLDLRMVIVEKYLMFYRVFEGDHKVIFYRVLNGKRNYSAFLDRYFSELDGND